MVPDPSEPLLPAFAHIATQHEPMLQRHALHLTGNPEIARDLVQETLLRALRNFHQLQPGTNPAAWLSTILTRLFYDHLKHQRVELKAVPELTAREELTCESTLATIADADLYVAVQALEPELRDVVELCYLQQMRYRDAAAKLSVPVGTVGTRLLRARARLRELLTQTSPKP
jgi:RNA polymerase sigma-70 factor (ECF subfamily)